MLAWPGVASAQLNVVQILQSAVDNPQDPRYAPVEQAIGAYLQGDLQGAMTRLAAARKAAPELPPAAVMLAQIHFGAGRIAAGQQALEQAVTDEPEDPEAYLIFGELALAEQRAAIADTLAQRALLLCEGSTLSEKRLAGIRLNAYGVQLQTSLQRERWKTAEKFARAMLSIDPQSTRARTSLGRALFLQGDLRAAFDTFKLLHEQQAGGLLPEVSMGLLYEELTQRGDPTKRDSARRAMEAALAKAPDDLTVRLVVARWAIDACELDLAQQCVDAAIQLESGSFEALRLAGLLARLQGDPAAAVASLQAAHIRSPVDLPVLTQLVLALADQKTEQKLSLEYGQLALRLASVSEGPPSREATVAWAWALHQAGRPHEAAAALPGALSGPLTGEFAYLAAALLAGQGDNRTAQLLLQPLLAKDACFPHRADAETLSKSLP
ncbi:tetratricopeptide repeat protein [Lignipirellula cremea]|uniref:Tetratricopeptide repeat protein n=1 Tax=Lignipirellula cremea TaxID=2528010 RepID=A0A518DYV4_9BACT|nr:tetratricopeptide repeat protein [Lignipirellula cremea]QDU97027.1 tetratricopeptide repeat protein [Lignipirellula cremea]